MQTKHRRDQRRLIRTALGAGDRAGHEYYRSTGAMLTKRRIRWPMGRWGRWVSKNFALSEPRARLYRRVREMDGARPKPPLRRAVVPAGSARSRP
jgi:hypothetical protein